jgi:glycosyltransferase involved in cell wall biosynthesis
VRLLFAVQRYGVEVLGGAEAHARELATRLAARGHEVQVVTSCARDYITWANFYPPGETVLDGVAVHRLPVARPRDMRLFGPLNGRVCVHPTLVPGFVQRTWMRLQGPYIPELPAWLAARAGAVDASVFFTYLYFTTWAGLPAAPRPILMHPTAHDEPPLRLSLFDRVFERPDAFAFSTEEEAALVRRRFGARQPSRVFGIGIELDPAGEPEPFRRRFGLGERPYVICVGRIDVNKGSVELFEHFTEYKRRRPGPLALVMVGEAVARLPRHPDVVMTGFVDDAAKNGGIRGAEALVQPSHFESFSLVLHEAWAMRVPALVQRRCEVLVAQSARSGAGLPYGDYREFESPLDRLLANWSPRREMGVSGRTFVEREYGWDGLLGRYEEFLDTIGAGAMAC